MAGQITPKRWLDTSHIISIVGMVFMVSVAAWTVTRKESADTLQEIRQDIKEIKGEVFKISLNEIAPMKTIQAVQDERISALEKSNKRNRRSNETSYNGGGSNK